MTDDCQHNSDRIWDMQTSFLTIPIPPKYFFHGQLLIHQELEHTGFVDHHSSRISCLQDRSPGDGPYGLPSSPSSRDVVDRVRFRPGVFWSVQFRTGMSPIPKSGNFGS